METDLIFSADITIGTTERLVLDMVRRYGCLGHLSTMGTVVADRLVSIGLVVEEAGQWRLTPGGHNCLLCPRLHCTPRRAGQTCGLAAAGHPAN